MRTPTALVFLAVSLALAAPATAATAGRKVNLAARSAALAAAPACDTEATGSRVRRREGDCAVSSYAFRTYSKQQIEMTGAFRLTDAVHRVDGPF